MEYTIKASMNNHGATDITRTVEGLELLIKVVKILKEAGYLLVDWDKADA